jgi:hypothetical protein
MRPNNLGCFGYSEVFETLIVTDIAWIKFDRNDPKSFPPGDCDLVVQTENGRSFSARFVAKSLHFSLKWSLWGNQGAVVRWRLKNERDLI